jgi:adenylosuccinate lyase
MAAVRAGKGRESAHEAIKEHAVAVALRMREGETDDLLALLAADDRIGLDEESIRSVVAKPLDFTGAATTQVRAIAEQVEAVTGRYPEAAGYRPGDIL